VPGTIRPLRAPGDLDHLCARHGIGPEDRAPDPARLVAALDELEEARAVWLAYEEEFAERRKREKHDGLRRPGSFDDWHRRTWAATASRGATTRRSIRRSRSPRCCAG